MAQTEVLKVSIKKDERPNNIYAIAQVISYEELYNKFSGTFSMGFTDKSMATFVASAISTSMGFGQVTHLGQESLAIIGEFVHTIMGYAITSWDKMGVRIKLGQPIALENSTIHERIRANVDAFVIILQLKVDSIAFRLTVVKDPINKIKGKRVLVVDDSQLIRNILRKQLLELDAEVELAEDGAMAIEKFQSFQPDITVMDIDVPKFDGSEAVLRLRAINQNAKIIMLSSSSRPDEVVTADTLNINTYIVKPFNAEQFIDAINKLI